MKGEIKHMKTIQIGDVFGELKTVRLEDSQTLANALQLAGLSVQNTQQIVSQSNAAQIEPGELATDGETYVITGNQVSG